QEITRTRANSAMRSATHKVSATVRRWSAPVGFDEAGNVRYKLCCCDGDGAPRQPPVGRLIAPAARARPAAAGVRPMLTRRGRGFSCACPPAGTERSAAVTLYLWIMLGSALGAGDGIHARDCSLP